MSTPSNPSLSIVIPAYNEERRLPGTIRDIRSFFARFPRAGRLPPAGKAGPAFLVTRTFDAVSSYNAAESYGLAIAHLSDRLRGGAPFATPWPTDDPGLSRAERRELQQLLIARGHDIGEAGGMSGARTREALKLEQAALGLAADGRAGQRVLQALRASPRP